MAAPAFSCPSCGAKLAGDAKFCGSCGRTILPGAAAPAGLDALTGRVVAGRYRIVAKLGAGGMGTVFRAEQVTVKRAIALKVLDPSMTANPELVRRFQAEAEVVARLSHPNTVTLFDFGQDEGLLYIAMELVPGKSLRDVIARESPMGAHRAVDIAEQIASSLADAHQHGIVHRDLKPDNVILSERAGRKDFARVLDFGIAKLYDDGANTPAPAMTRAGQILGTPQYMAPEQVTGGTVDGRTDIYALGVMIYEMLTGRPPFAGDSVIALLSAHMHDAPPPLPPSLGIPVPLERLLFQCLAKEPGQRPPAMVTVATTLADLRALLDPGPRRSGGMGAMPPMPTPLPGGQPMFTPPPLPMPVATPGPSSAPSFTPPPLPMPGAQASPTPMPVAPPQWAVNTPQPAPAPVARKRSPVWPWLVLALIVVGGGGAAAFFGLRDQGDTPAPAPAPPAVVTAPSGPGETFSSSRYGYSVQLPAGLSMKEDANSGGAIATGTYDGNVISIAVNPIAGWADVESRVTQIEQATGGAAKFVEKRTRRIRDTELVSVVYDLPSTGSRYETVFYPGEQALAVTFASTTAYFDETAALRDALFRDRFQPGGN